eukprot:11162292-Lingulodinium_polyedra.AAC.1
MLCTAAGPGPANRQRLARRCTRSSTRIVGKCLQHGQQPYAGRAPAPGSTRCTSRLQRSCCKPSA